MYVCGLGTALLEAKFYVIVFAIIYSQHELYRVLTYCVCVYNVTGEEGPP